MKKWKTVNSKRVANNIEKILKTKNIELMTKATYDFLYITSGFIAHYDINGFKHHYQDTDDLLSDLRNSSDIARPNYYVDDMFFQKDEHSKDYYTSKSETLNKIKEMISKFE